MLLKIPPCSRISGGDGDLKMGGWVCGQTYQVVDVTGQHDGLDLESGGGNFGNDRIADGADGEVVEEGVYQQQGAESPCGAFVLSRDDTQAADEHEETE